MTYPKKLIEVALPLEAINKEAAREKSIRHGHPSTLHLWWARRPLAACRAVLFSSLVDDPSEYIQDEEKQKAERQRLFNLIEELVKWENSNNEEVLDAAKLEIARSVARNLGLEMPVGKHAIEEFLATQAPPVLDPFAGGGSIPLEAQRLGLRAYASDLNPVAVLINKALIEIPPKFANLPPVHPVEEAGQGDQSDMFKGREWKGAQGLAEDVRYYGNWMRQQAEERIGQLYPKVKISAAILAERPDLKEQGIKAGEELTVIAWLWARTVKCPNPACGVQMPLVRSFELSKKKDRQAWVEIEPTKGSKGERVRFIVKTGQGKAPKGTVERTGASCVACGSPVPFDHIRDEGKAGRMNAQLLAAVADGPKGRVYFSPLQEHEDVAKSAVPAWKPETDLPEKALGFRVQLYGMTKHADLFTDRQLVALTTFSDLVGEARSLALQHARQAGLKDDGLGLEAGGSGAQAYADAVAVYLAFAASKLLDRNSSLASWDVGSESLRGTFARHALPMVWDFCEVNPFETMGSYAGAVNWILRVIDGLPIGVPGFSEQRDARKLSNGNKLVLATDPPYYDNIGYADLSDFFYIWLRQMLHSSFSSLLTTLMVPKSEELVATPYRFNGNRERAKEFFEVGLFETFKSMSKASSLLVPTSVFYAFKQTESVDSTTESRSETVTASTGWETMLQGLLDAQFEITGTWPMRTELASKALQIGGANILASSIVLVCRPKTDERDTIVRRDFLILLEQVLPKALQELRFGNVAPVDFAQAAIGPGMAIFSRYNAVLESDGSKMSVRTALGLINQVLDQYLAEQEGDFDAETRWALTWFEQFGHNAAEFGVAETLSKAKNTSIEGLAHSGILQSRAGKVRLLPREELDADWTPHSDKQLSVWEACHYLIRALETDGEAAAAALLTGLGALAEPGKDLAYRLYSICERKSWAGEALGYNMLVAAWPRLKEMAAKQTPALF
ncbi:MAG: DUF1156 domain-containing protein [Anaerolineales bacterium]|nr:MAG: DUF1156 domain-containing protein [Anaerolineales bacterium]